MKTRLVALRLLAPVQPERLAEALDGVVRVMVVEQNHSAQFYRYLRSMYDLPGKPASFHRPGPLPLRPGELMDAILEWGRMTERGEAEIRSARPRASAGGRPLDDSKQANDTKADG
jgi:2-oxoglutarate ferredoxin oxidoreductase subunit alpha